VFRNERSRRVIVCIQGQYGSSWLKSKLVQHDHDCRCCSGVGGRWDRINVLCGLERRRRTIEVRVFHSCSCLPCVQPGLYCSLSNSQLLPSTLLSTSPAAEPGYCTCIVPRKGLKSRLEKGTLEKVITCIVLSFMLHW